MTYTYIYPAKFIQFSENCIYYIYLRTKSYITLRKFSLNENNILEGDILLVYDLCIR